MPDLKQTLRRAITFVGLTALGVGSYLWLTRTAASPKPRSSREQGQPVRVIEVSEAAAVPRVIGYGEVAAQRSWQGLAEVAGTIIEMGPNVQVGRIVREGDILFEVDPEELELEKRRTVASAKGVRAQISELKAREASAKASLAVDAEVLALANKELERTESLYRQGTASLSEVEAAEASVLSAKKSVVSLQNTLAELPASRRILEAQLEEVDVGVTGAELVLARTRIVAPFTMRISELNVTTGQSVSSGQVLIVGEGLDVLEVTARLPLGGIDPLLPARPERSRPGPAPGSDAAASDPPPSTEAPDEPNTPASTKTPSEPDAGPPADPAAGSEQPRPGRWFDRVAEVVTPTVRLRMAGVDATWPARFSRFAGVDPLTRTTGVVVEVDRSQRREGSRDIQLSAGMHVSVEFVGAAKPGCLALPIDAVHDGVVYVVADEDRLERRDVEIAWSQEEFVCVESGLAVGERVVVSEVVPAVNGMRLAPTVDAFETARLAGLLGTDEGAQ
ncbi:Membrane fusion component of tripartite multidrug resistance system [Enhygromyxa salina]|uniref:Membrane fusion component of tripartite multidrug resistance system n=1 Tax=Enhygromyxa salina TaxID=215803 RepID=A0A0C2DG40_9BACT|nr:TolC family protein [Enhygromyxa salina]KIG18652.1 Membrane fusion component of tripartite multidrug resistance system [Enhygromyxa salina]